MDDNTTYQRAGSYNWPTASRTSHALGHVDCLGVMAAIRECPGRTTQSIRAQLGLTRMETYKRAKWLESQGLVRSARRLVSSRWCACWEPVGHE